MKTKNMIKDVIRKIKTRIWIELSPQGFVNGYILFPIRRQLKKMGLGDRDLEKIKCLKDIHRGKRCFVIATGPSLKIEDIKKIEKEYTIGINSIFKLYDETSWRPTYYAMTDYNLTNTILKEHTILIDDYARSNCFVNIINKKDVKGEKVIYIENNWLDHAYHYGKSKRYKYEEDLALGVYDYYSITHECIIYAIYMGFSEIYLLGADNDYIGEKKHFSNYDEDSNIDYERAMLIQQANDIGYSMIKKIADKKNVRIYNTTRGGKLELFPRKDLDSVVLKRRK